MLRLDDILAPRGAAALSPEANGPTHLPGPPPGATLPGWPEIAALLDMTALWSADTLQLVQDGAPLPPERYCVPFTDRDLKPVQRAEAARVLALLGAGASLRARQVETLDPGLRALAAGLEAALPARVAGDLLLRRGAGPLADLDPAAGDQLLLTLDGPITATPTLPGGATAGATGPVVLATGDRLLLPRGWRAALHATGDQAACAILTILRPTGLELLQALADAAGQEPLLQAPLPVASAPGAASSTPSPDAYLGALGERLGALARDAAGTAVRIAREFPRDLEPYGLPRAVLQPAERWRLNAHGLSVVEGIGGWLLKGPRGAVPIPAGRERLVAWIIGRERFERRELDDAFPGSEAGLVTGLLRDLAQMKVVIPSA